MWLFSPGFQVTESRIWPWTLANYFKKKKKKLKEICSLITMFVWFI